MVGAKRTKRVVGTIIRSKIVPGDDLNGFSPTAVQSKPSVYHALVVIFLEFFAWGLLTTTTINVTHSTFPTHTFLCNGLIQGVKGILSFLSAPLIGALSDVMGRKPFLFLTVICTCAPIPFMLISPWWYFALISISGLFAVTFSVVFAYVADITTEDERSAAYGLVSATFAASLITSPAIGAFIENTYGQNVVVMIATAVAALDVMFILLFIPESLPEKMRVAAGALGSHITWDKADPFGALKKLGHDRLILILCITVLLSYLPEAGEYSCFFVYLKLIINFSEQQVASFIAFVGILSVLAQTIVLSVIMSYVGAKPAIVIGLTAEMVQLALYGFSSAYWLMWIAGIVAALSSITYPAISAFVSAQANPDQQGVAQGVVTGIRGLCNGLGPALFGFIFYLFGVDLNDHGGDSKTAGIHPEVPKNAQPIPSSIPGPPFAVGAVLVFCAIIVSTYIPHKAHNRHKVVTNRSNKFKPSRDSRQSTTVEPSVLDKLTGTGQSFEAEKLLVASDDNV